MGDSIGQRIKAKRLELKLTQNQVAEKLFVTQQTVARWENGKHTLPVKAVQDLSELFDVPTACFLVKIKLLCVDLIFLHLLVVFLLTLSYFG